MTASRGIARIVSFAIIIGGLVAASRYHYLLFHSLAELFSVIVAAGLFMIAWNSRTFMENNYLLNR